MTDQIKTLFNQEAKKFYLKENRQFLINENNKKFLDAICKYFAQDLAFESDYGGELNKGLYVFGGCGLGKTSSFKIIQNISRKYSMKQLWFPIVGVNTVVLKYNTSGNDKDYIIRNYSRGKILFDDLGSETEASNFGKEDIFIRIMEMRYNEFINKGTKTFITSNLSFEDIKNRYGLRLYDRFFQMFNQLKLTGETHRY